MGMASYGAIAGGAGAISDMVLMQMEEAKATRLENLRSQNNQSTNTLNNKERNDYAMSQMSAEADIGETAADSQLGRDKELTSYEADQKNREMTPTEKEVRAGVAAGHDAKDLWDPRNTTASGKDTRPDVQKKYDFWLGLGKSPEEAEELAQTGTKKPRHELVQEVFEALVANVANTGIADDVLLERANKSVDSLLQKPDAPDPGAKMTPEQAAATLKSGDTFTGMNGKTYRVR